MPIAVAFPVKVNGKHVADWMCCSMDHQLAIQDCSLYFDYNSDNHYTPLSKYKFLKLQSVAVINSRNGPITVL